MHLSPHWDTIGRKEDHAAKRTLLLSTLLFALPNGAADAPDTAIVPEGARVEKLWSEGTFTEGPAYGPDGCVYFSDIGNRIMRFDPASGKTSEYRNPSGRANGLDFDPQGRLIAAATAAEASPGGRDT